MMYRLLAPGGPMDYWREAEWDKLGEQARFSLDAKVRADAYKRMQEIMDVYYPWLPVIVPVESHGVAELRQLAVQPEPDDGAAQGSVLLQPVAPSR